MEIPRPPNPLRAFEGLTVDAATQLAQKMGYRVIISGVFGVSSRMPDYPKPGEIGFFTEPQSGLVKSAILPEVENPSRLPPIYPLSPMRPFDRYPRWPYNPDFLVPPPERPKNPCAICQKKVIGEVGYYLCGICHGHICNECGPKHKLCQGKPVPRMPMTGG
jgi:hypothetical protein